MSVQAWGNRCPHRGMRLSYGFVRGDSLACAYHGWHYNCAAICHYIPAHPDLIPPDSIKPEIFTAVDQQGILWVSVDNSSADSSTVPVSLPDSCVGVRSITFDCRVDQAVSAFYKTPPLNASQAELTACDFCDEPIIVAFGDTVNDPSVFVLFQSSEPLITNAHVMANRAWTANERIGLSRWCESVRRIAESTVS